MEKLLERIHTLAAASPQPKAADLSDPFSGTWQNELNSQMVLQVSGNAVTGTYTTAVGTLAGIPFDLVGYVQGNLITFTVDFAADSVTSLASWSGQIAPTTEGPATLFTLWYLVVPAPIWESTSAGSDTFTMQS